MTDFAAARTAMVDCQVRPSDVTSYPIIDALLAAPRERFVPSALRPVAYAGDHVRLAPGRVLLDPRVFAKMLDAAEIEPDDLVLDLGCGMGYSSWVLARLAAAVVAVESDESLARSAEQLLDELEANAVMVQRGQLTDGAPEHGPFNVIFVNGGVEELPRRLTDQLAEGGRLVAVAMDGPVGHCDVWRRTGERLSRRRAFDASAPVLEGFARAPAFTF